MKARREILAAVVLSAVGVRGAMGAPTVTTLATFNAYNGTYPLGGVIVDAAGNLYGTTYMIGYEYPNLVSEYSSVFMLRPGEDSVRTVSLLGPSPGPVGPTAGVIMDTAGNIYGTTSQGGLNGTGTVFRLQPSIGYLQTTLASLYTGTSNSASGLIVDSAGNLYGTTTRGGVYSAGSVYKVPAGGGPAITLASFSGLTGVRPFGSVVADADGNLYGMTQLGPAGHSGTVFKVPAGTVNGFPITLATFDGANGANPTAGLIIDAAGNLYGTTPSGGPNGGGTVFKIPAGGGALTTLATGMYPNSSLIMDAAGNLYGTTDGSVFKVPAGGGSYSTLVTIDGLIRGGISVDATGNFYGTASNGGPYGYGAVFKVSDTGFVLPGAASLSSSASGTGLGSVEVVGSGGSYALGNLATSGVTAGSLSITGGLATSSDPVWVYLDLADASATIPTLAGVTVVRGSYDFGNGVTYDARLTFDARPTGGSPVFFNFTGLPAINNIGVVPEPGGVVGMVVAVGMGIRRRRR